MAHHITLDCLICGTCYEICPTRSIVEYDWYYQISASCAECNACVRVCPNAAIVRKKYRAEAAQSAG